MLPTHDKIINEIKNGKISPFYLLSGTEPYFIDNISSFLVKKLITDSAKDFDYHVLYGKDTTVNEIIEVAKRYPMVSEYNVVLIREAQYLEKKYDDLTKYVLSPQNKSIVIFCYKNKLFDKRSKLYKAVFRSGVIFESKVLYDNQIANWINSEINHLKLKASPKSVQLLIEFLGSDLGKIKQEISKLKILCNDKLITPEIIEKFVGINKDYNNYELINAISLKNKRKCLEIIFYLSNNPKNHPLILIISSIFQFFKKLLLLHGIDTKDDKKISSLLGVNPYFLSQYSAASKLYSMKDCSNAIDVIYKADIKSKGINGNNDGQKEILIDLLNDLF